MSKISDHGNGRVFGPFTHLIVKEKNTQQQQTYDREKRNVCDMTLSLIHKNDIQKHCDES